MRRNRGKISFGKLSIIAFVVIVLTMVMPFRAFAQETTSNLRTRPLEVKGVFGLSVFVDGQVANEVVATHGVVGASVRLGLGDRWSVRPQFLYTNEIYRGQFGRSWIDHENFFALGHIVYDLKTRGSVTPYWLIGGGIFHHRLTVDGRPESTSTSLEYHVGGGFGARFRLSEQWVLETEALFGGNPMLQFHAGVGYAF